MNSSRRSGKETSADPVGALADRMHLAAVHLLRRLRRDDDASGPSPPALSAITTLVSRGALTLGQLAEAEAVRPPTMTKLVQQLVQDGLVMRKKDEDDGRVRRIVATSKAWTVLDAGRSRRVAALRSRLAALPKADRATLSRAVEIMDRLARQEPAS